MSRLLPLSLAAVIVAGASLLTAGDAEARGTHFIAELDGGVTSIRESSPSGNDSALPSYGLALGVGGKFTGGSTRYYFLLRYNGAHLSDARLDANYSYFAAAMRLLWPIIPAPGGGGLRFFVEGGLGRGRVGTGFEAGGIPFERSHWGLGGHGYLGFQYRFTRGFSAGVRGGVDFMETGSAGLESSVSGLDLDVRPGLALTTSFHF